MTTEWVTVKEELGETVHFTEGVPFIGVYEGITIVNFVDEGSDETRPTNAYSFRGIEGDPRKYTVWGSYNIDSGMAEVPVGSPTRIEFVQEIPRGKGKGTVKEYRIAYQSGGAV